MIIIRKKNKSTVRSSIFKFIPKFINYFQLCGILSSSDEKLEYYIKYYPNIYKLVILYNIPLILSRKKLNDIKNYKT
jgi:vesicle coat complex subunit